MRIGRTTPWLTLLALLVSTPALAYVGPGAGLTLLSALWGLLVAVLAAVGFLVLWPLRRWRRRRQALAAGAAGEDDALAELPEEGVAQPLRSERRPDGEVRPGVDVDGR